MKQVRGERCKKKTQNINQIEERQRSEKKKCTKRYKM